MKEDDDVKQMARIEESFSKFAHSVNEVSAEAMVKEIDREIMKSIKPDAE